VLCLTNNRRAGNAHQCDNEHKKICTTHQLFRCRNAVVLLNKSRQMLLSRGHTEKEDKQKHKSHHHCIAEGRERNRYNLVLNQSDQEYRYTVAEGQILDAAFLGKAVDHKEGLKADHQAATEDLQVNVKAQSILRQR